MKFTRMPIADVVHIAPQVHTDERGYFVETFRQDLLEAFIEQPLHFVQDNQSKTARGVLRGLHYQLPPAAQSKLVRVVQGRVLDVAVDLRQHSPTFGQHVRCELSGVNHHQLFIPRGFAHGFLVLEADTIVAYKTDAYYAPEFARGVAFNDPSLNIDWGMRPDDLTCAARDENLPGLHAAEVFNI